MNKNLYEFAKKKLESMTVDELEASLKAAGIDVVRKLNKADQGVQYDRGWAHGQELIKAWGKTQQLTGLGEAAIEMSGDEVKQLDEFTRGLYDCIVQWQKSGESQMIKIASVVIVIDPDTGHVLAATRRGTTDDWGFIGGKTDGEPPLEAACREFEEETGERLIAAPDYLGCFKDEENWDIHVYICLDPYEAALICGRFRDGPREIEKDILVGLVPYSKLMVKTFAQFNIDLIPHILKAML